VAENLHPCSGFHAQDDAEKIAARKRQWRGGQPVEIKLSIFGGLGDTVAR